MTETLSPRARLLLEAARRNFELLREHEKVSTTEVNFIVEQIVASVRSFKPLLLTPFPETP